MTAPHVTAPPLPARARPSRLPLAFEPNRGLWDSRVDFVARGRGATVFLSESQAVLALRGGGVLRFELGGAATSAPFPADTLPGISNYFLGNSPKQWLTGVPTFGRVIYPAVYPGIDFELEGGLGELEFDFRVAPGADPAAIRFRFDGARSAELAADGNLRLDIGERTLVARAPRVFERREGLSTQVSGAFTHLGGDWFGFQTSRADLRAELFIDPVIEASTYLGGTGSDSANAVALDSSGAMYITGSTSSANFPTRSALQGYDGGSDVFVAKLDASGTTLLYSTFLGGSADESGQGIAVDTSGQVVVAGSTSSANFPVKAAFQSAFGGMEDAFAAKLTATGASLVYSTYLGGTQRDNGQAVALDGAGNAYVAGSTSSVAFPTWRALRSARGFPDGFITELDPMGRGNLSNTFSTFLGGGRTDGINGIALSSAGDIYVTGTTNSLDFPTLSAAEPTQPVDGGQDAFVTRIAAGGGAFVYSTYLGGSSLDTGNAIAVDSQGAAYVTGQTTATDFPVTDGGVQTHLSNGYDGYVTKVSPDGRQWIWSSYLGGEGVDFPHAIAVSAKNFAYVTGVTGSSTFPLASPLYPNIRGGGEAFLTVFNAAGNGLVYSTFIGGTGADDGLGVAVDSFGTAVVVGSTTSSDFSSAPDAGFQPGYADGGDAFVIRISQPSPALLSLSPDSGPVTGGTSILFDGQNFLQGVRVTIGGAPVQQLNRLSAANLTGVTPSGDAGPADVVLTNPDGQASTLAGGYVFVGPLAAIAPPDQTVDAGTPFILDGSGSSPSAGAALVRYDWQQTQGPSGAPLDAGAQQFLGLPVPGVYAFTLQVTDTKGLTSPTASARVQVVGETPPVPPYRLTGCGCAAGTDSAGSSLAVAALLMVAMRRFKGASRARPRSRRSAR